MRTYLSLVALAMAVAALCGGALAWDGSNYLFQVLDRQRLFTPHGRLANALLQWPVLLASRLTGNTAALQLIFGLAYAAVPVVALALAWWVVRREAPALFVWPALSIGLFTLPGLFYFTAEANIALMLAWPVTLAVLTGLRRESLPAALAAGVAVLLSHPFALPLFAFAAALALLVGLRRPDERPRLWRGAALLALAAGIWAALLLAWPGLAGWGAPAWATLAWSYEAAMRGGPIRALVCATVAAATVALTPLAERRGWRNLTLGLYVCELVSIGAAAVLLCVWALNPFMWQRAGIFTAWSLPLSLALMGLAAADRLWLTPASADSSEQQRLWRRRLGTVQASGAALLVVVTAQSLVWRRLNGRLEETLAASPWACVSMASVAWLQQTPLNHWATPHHALLIQGRAPAKLLLPGDECGQQTFAEGVWLDSYSVRPWGRGWLDLAPLGRQVSLERTEARGCSFQLTTGWHTTESDGPYWWRWSDGRDARIRVLSERDLQTVLSGSLETFERPNRIDVLVNGARAGTLEVDWVGMRAFAPLPLPLSKGENLVELRSRNAPVLYDQRLLSFSVGGLALTPTDSAPACERRT